jgi:hypothetical protein
MFFCDEFEHHYAEGVDVCLFIRLVLDGGHFLKWHVLESAWASEGGDVLFSEDGKAKISYFECSLPDEDVGKFEVVVQYPFAPELFISSDELIEDVYEFIFGK